MIYGMAVLWWKAIDDIPLGWQLCDGTNGTPDLRSKFIKGTAPDADPCGEVQTNIAGGTGDYSHSMAYICRV